VSYVIAAPEIMTSAATDLATIGSNVSAAHAAAAARILAVVPAAADEVSASIAQLFSTHAADYQAMAGRAAAFQGQFVQNLTASAGSYASVEAAIVSWLQSLNLSADLFVSNIDAFVSEAVGSFLTGTGAYWLGGFGEPGLLPRIAFEIFTSLGFNSFFLPLAIALLPLVLVYAVETGQLF
jgi:hypothetical protein